MTKVYMLGYLIATIFFAIIYASIVWSENGSHVGRVLAASGLCVSLVCFVLTLVIYQDKKK